LGLILAVVFPPVGLILSIIAFSRLKKTGKSGKALVIVGLIIGVLGTISCIVFMVVILILGNGDPYLGLAHLVYYILFQA
jgi:hypothetical protein